MKRVLTIVIAAAVLFGLAAAPVSAAAPLVAEKRSATLAVIPAPIAPVAIPVPGRIPPVNGCVFTKNYPLFYDNGLNWSDTTIAFNTPMFRAGACRSVIMISFGNYNAPPCVMAKVNTYNEDGSVRVKAPWVKFTYAGQKGDLRPTIDVGRKFRVFAYACEPFRARQFPPSFSIYAY